MKITGYLASIENVANAKLLRVFFKDQMGKLGRNMNAAEKRLLFGCTVLDV